jgi:hypothetical protein
VSARHLTTCAVIALALLAAIATVSAAKVPAKLPGTYHCNYALGNTVGIFPLPPNGLYDLRLRKNRTYAFGGSAGYPGGTFRVKKNVVSFHGGYLDGVHGRWIARLSGVVAGHQGIRLSRFKISPTADPGKHDCVT